MFLHVLECNIEITQLNYVFMNVNLVSLPTMSLGIVLPGVMVDTLLKVSTELVLSTVLLDIMDIICCVYHSVLIIPSIIMIILLGYVLLVAQPTLTIMLTMLLNHVFLGVLTVPMQTLRRVLVYLLSTVLTQQLQIQLQEGALSDVPKFLCTISLLRQTLVVLLAQITLLPLTNQTCV